MALPITLDSLQPVNGEWAFYWSWDTLKYHMKAKKENGIWKFSYLEGFRPDPPQL
jgi:hypothetical protein